jgi:peptide methionine sulfoxide reductase MsrA
VCREVVRERHGVVAFGVVRAEEQRHFARRGHELWLPGVASTRVGCTGGDVTDATYRNHGTHSEAIEIVFDPDTMTFRNLLEFFFQIDHPTTSNRQGPDRGVG